MSDIVTGKIFVDGEKGITSTKMNQIISQAVIQPDFVTTKPASSTLDPTDQLLEVKSTGAYAKVTGQQLSDSVATSPSITAMRLRSFNAIHNSTFECDQRLNGSVTTNAFVCDRWIFGGTLVANCTAAKIGQGVPGVLYVPGTNFRASLYCASVTLNTQKTTLAATDYLYLIQNIEGVQFRELSMDVNSLTLAVQSTVAPLSFSVCLRDNASAYTLTKLCTITTANVWTFITLPNLPIWAPSGTFGIQPGTVGYVLLITLAAGTNFQGATDVWKSGNLIGSATQDNFCGKAVNSVFYLGFVQHEPGPVCTTLMDKPFTQNLDECLRYFEKSYVYNTQPGTAAAGSGINGFVPAGGSNPIIPVRFKKVMAKTPTIAGYSISSGTVNTVRDMTAPADRTISASQLVSDSGFNGFTVASGASTIWQAAFHYTADTGW